jgi:hypothetical protein
MRHHRKECSSNGRKASKRTRSDDLDSGRCHRASSAVKRAVAPATGRHGKPAPGASVRRNASLHSPNHLARVAASESDRFPTGIGSRNRGAWERKNLIRKSLPSIQCPTWLQNKTARRYLSLVPTRSRPGTYRARGSLGAASTLSIGFSQYLFYSCPKVRWRLLRRRTGYSP